MSNRRRTKRSIRNKVFRLFLLYIILVPLVFFLLDKSNTLESLKNETWLFILKMAGIALGISVILSFWGHRDPELRKY